MNAATIETPADKATRFVEKIKATLRSGATVWMQSYTRNVKYKVTKKNDVTECFRARGREIQATLNRREWFKIGSVDDNGKLFMLNPLVVDE